MPPRDEPAPGAQLVAYLQPFDACADLLDYVHTEAAEFVGAYGLPGQQVMTPWSNRAFLDDGGRLLTPASTPTFGPIAGPQELNLGGQEDDTSTDFSTTNLQELDVDEADSVKTDGTIVVIAQGEDLYVIDVTGERPQLLDSIQLPQNATDSRLFLFDDRVLVVAEGGVSTVRPYVVEPELPGGDESERYVPYDPYESIGELSTVVTEVDLSDPTDLEVASTRNVEGHFIAARMIDGMARIVVSSAPSSFDFVYPSSTDAEAEAKAANQAIVAGSTLDDWIPEVATQVGTGDPVVEPLLDCEAVNRPEEFAGYGMLSVLTVDLDDPVGATTPLSDDAIGVMASGETAYASSDRLYVATNRFIDPAVYAEDADPEQATVVEDDYETELHAFDLTGEGAASYVTSAVIDGHLLNQFSMSEQDGRLRVVTTTGSPWGPASSETFLAVLDEGGTGLTEIGRVGDLGKGEDVYAVRFDGDVAYVVTFRQTDPLYVVDLSDPTRPVVAGELDLLGYSSYLHPIGDGQLIGIGQAATQTGQATGTQVSLFDVSDPSAPHRVQQWEAPGGTSEAELDQLAFTWWADEDLAVFPLHVSGNDRFTGVVGLEVTSEAMTERGRIVHNSYLGDLVVSRSLVVGDRLYTVSTDLFVANDLRTFEEDGRILLD